MKRLNMGNRNIGSSRIVLQPLSLAHLKDFHAIMTDAAGLKFSQVVQPQEKYGAR